METFDSKSAKMKVTRTLLKKDVDVEDSTIEVNVYKTATAYVGVRAAATVNLGNYESAKVEVSIMIPAYVEEIDAVFTQAKAWVDEKMKEEYRELKGVTN